MKPKGDAAGQNSGMAPRLRRADCSGPGIRRAGAGRGFAYLDDDGDAVDEPRTRRSASASCASRPPGRTSGSARTPTATSRRRASTPPAASSTATTRPGASGATRRSSTTCSRFARALPRCASGSTADLGDRDALDARARARLRRAAARPRLLPHRHRGVRGRERELRAGDDAQGARDDRGRRHDGLRLPRQERQAPRPGRSSTRRRATIVGALKRRRGGGDELLAYKEGGAGATCARDDINDYLKEPTGGDFSAKDFRTWNATVLAAVALAVSGEAAGRRRRRKRADHARGQGGRDYLGNTPAVCRASYIDPRVFDAYEAGLTIRPALERVAEAGAGRAADPPARARAGGPRPAQRGEDSPAVEQLAA